MKILVAHDGSGHADAAIHSLANAGLPEKGEALVLHAFHEPAESRGKGRQSDSAWKASRRAAKRLKSVLPSWTVKAEVIGGHPARAITERADAWNPDLVVVGSGRRHPLTGILVGSVALQVLLHARRDVRVGRKPKGTGKGALKILVGFDGSIYSERAIKMVAKRKWPENTIVRVLTIIDPRLPAMLSVRSGQPKKSGKGAGVNWIGEKQAGCIDRLKRAGFRTEAKSVIGDPRRELLKEILKWKADTVFVGNKGLGAWSRFLLGSVSMGVAMSSPCSVELVRD